MSRIATHVSSGRHRIPGGWLAGLAALAGIFLSWPATAAEPPRNAPSAAAFLEAAWPGHPEWLAMLADILVKGDQIGGGDGWFRKAVAQTRFDWKATRAALDRDGDGAVSRAEFPGTDADFARVDRDRDGSLTAADFDFATPSQSPGPLLFSRADRDGNGKVTREEFVTYLNTLDSGGLGFLSQADLQQAFAPPPPAAQGPSGAPTRWTFLKSFFREELGAFPPGPSLDETAPDFTLRTADGRDEVTLSKVVGPKPVVLVFGNFTCGPFRREAGNLEKIYRRYNDRATFLMVYVREAHPTDGWRMENNDRTGVALPQPRTYAERVGVARRCSTSLGFGFPVLVDTIDDPVNNAYSGIPSRCYLIDRQGKVAYKSGRGPFGFKPGELEQSLVLLLQTEPRPVGGPRASARVPLLDDAEAWKHLPAAERGGGQPLPNWARALARSLPRTTAAMLDLDRLHRTRSPLGPELRAKMRWVAAVANRCDYSRAYAEADLRRAGLGRDAIKALDSDHAGVPENERAALDFARKMTLAADTVTDDEVAAIKAAYGEKTLAAMVLLLASANFQDRLLLALDIPIEHGGPLPPVEVRFVQSGPAPSVPARTRPNGRPTPEVPERVDDADWLASDIDELKQGLETQKANAGRIRVPSFDEVLKGLPAGYPVPKNPTRIKWTLVCMGYQPELAIAWSACTRAFGEEAKQDRVFEESLFWVVTRTIHCFY